MTDLISRLLGLQQKQDQQSAKSQHDIVIAVADGKYKSDAAILEAIAEVELTPYELQERLNVLAERRRLQVIVAGEPKLRKELASLETEQEAARAEFVKANEKWTAIEKRTTTAQESCRSKLHRIGTAKDKLRQTSSVQAKQSSLVVSDELNVMNRRRDKLIGLLSTHSCTYFENPIGGGPSRRIPTFSSRTRELKRTLTEPDRPNKPPVNVERLEREIAEISVERANAENELAKLEKQIAAFDKKIKAADEELISA